MYNSLWSCAVGSLSLWLFPERREWSAWADSRPFCHSIIQLHSCLDTASWQFLCVLLNSILQYHEVPSTLEGWNPDPIHLKELIIYLSKFRGSSLYPRWFGFQPMENRHLRPAWPKTNSPPELEPPTWVSLRSLVGWLVGWNVIWWRVSG